MALGGNIGKKSNAVMTQGGNSIIHVKLGASYALPTTFTLGTNIVDLGHIATSTPAQTASKTTANNESGELVASTYTYERTTTGTLMQMDQALVDWLGDEVKDSDILEIKYCGVVEGKDHWHFRIGQVTPQYALPNPTSGSSSPYEHTGYDLAADVTISAASLASIAAVLTLSTVSFFPTAAVVLSSSKSYAYVSV